MSDQKKKRLRVLNEVLPSPTVGEAESGPRQRTLGHMQRLLALAAASATLGSGCPDKSQSGPQATPEPLATAEPPPPPPPSATATAAPSGSAPSSSYEKEPPLESTAAPRASAPSKIKPPPKPPKPPKGYWVVDLLSPPVHLPVLPLIRKPE